MTPVEFLTARLDELEAAEHRKFRRRDFRELGPGDAAKYSGVQNGRMGHPDDELGESYQWPDGRWMNRAEVEAWRAVFLEPNPDPYVLADIAAKRAIVEQYTYAAIHAESYHKHVADYDLVRDAQMVRDQLAIVIRALIQPFAAHPDFDPAWAVPGA